jgi:hypothetical protein
MYVLLQTSTDICLRGVVARGNMRNSILSLPLVYGTPEYIPDRALWAATVCLGILASVYRYEEVNDGHEGISVSAPQSAFKNIHGDDDEEVETKGIPRNIAIPLRQVCTRMGRALPHLTQFDVSIYNYKLRDPTSVQPYLVRTENMDLRWPVSPLSSVLDGLYGVNLGRCLMIAEKPCSCSVVRVAIITP